MGSKAEDQRWKDICGGSKARILHTWGRRPKTKDGKKYAEDRRQRYYMYVVEDRRPKMKRRAEDRRQGYYMHGVEDRRPKMERHMRRIEGKDTTCMGSKTEDQRWKDICGGSKATILHAWGRRPKTKDGKTYAEDRRQRYYMYVVEDRRPK